jgi:pSer/pThr/pTyr-binding forkhead associated (FHA) protein
VGLPVICGVCRGENPPGMKFCRACGSGLSTPSPIGTGPTAPGQGFVPPRPMAPSPPVARPVSAPSIGSTIACPRCGTSTPIGFAYCQQCGLHLQAIAPTDPGAMPRPPVAAPPLAGLIAGIDPQGLTIAQPESVRPSGPPSQAASAVPVAGPAWGTAVLVNRDGSDGQRFSLTSTDTVIGRAGADIPFDDDRFLAKQHARFERTPEGSVRIHAIDTLNGVFKKADGPVELADGSTVLVGREVLVFEWLSLEEKTVHPLVRHGVSLFGSPPREPYARLHQIVPSGGYRDVRHLIADETVLGREEGDIVFRDDAFMSRRHAAITWDGKVARVTDLGSSNGTFVRINGPAPLKHGDHVRMGDQLLRVELVAR